MLDVKLIREQPDVIRKALQDRRIANIVILALHTPDGKWLYNPARELVLQPRTGVIFMGTPEARATLERYVAAPAA